MNLEHMFLKLTQTSGEKLLINIEQIVYIYPSNGGSVIRTTNEGVTFEVKESFDDIEYLIPSSISNEEVSK